MFCLSTITRTNRRPAGERRTPASQPNQSNTPDSPMKSRIKTPRLLCSAGFYILMLLLSVFASTQAFASPAIPSGHIRIHYHRPDGNYSGWTVYAFDDTTENTGNYGGGPVQVTGTDSFGAYFDVGVTT